MTRFSSAASAKFERIVALRQHPVGVEVESVPSFYLSSVQGGMLGKQTHHYPTPQLAFAAMRAGDFGLDLKGSACASEAFFPFADGLIQAAEAFPAGQA